MSNLNPLSGFDLVKRGITQNQATLPELGLKDVCPTGSWLEQKQIQAATDARKHLLSAERIEKSYSLSHAEWRENLMLAEVTQKVGGHWQFMGHNIGKQLFIYPEEALFLMEINCLLLKHNDLKVSIQQAYSLLFRDKISLTQYMVYASLSRLGYKVLRHNNIKPKKNSDDQREMSQDDIPIDNQNKEDVIDEDKESNKTEEDIPKTETMKYNEAGLNLECQESENQSNDILKSSSDHNDSVMEVSPIPCDKPDSELNKASDVSMTCMGSDNKQHKLTVYRRQIQRIKNRAFRPSDSKILGKCFKNLPNVLHGQRVSVNVPDKEFVPDNIGFSKAVYTLNLKALKSKNGRRASRSYSTSDEASGSHVGRVRNVSEGSTRTIANNSSESPRDRFMARLPNMRPTNIMRSQQMNFFQSNMCYPRFFSNIPSPRIHHFLPRWQNFYRPFYYETNPNQFVAYRKRSRNDVQKFHFDSIKRLATRLKGLLRAGLPQTQSLDALNKLIETYNNRYSSSLQLTADYEFVDGQMEFETIELEDDESPKNKKPRLDDSYAENLEDIKRLAIRLKELESEGKTTARHRRAFSSLVRTFNKSYNAEIYMNGDYVVSDKRHIVLDSSSDSDCEINEPSVSSAGGKKLRNPFNVLKQLSEKRTKNRLAFSPSTSGESGSKVNPAANDPYNELFIKALGENWLPGKDDFGRPAIPESSVYLYTDNSIYNYAKYHSCEWINWAELKTAFLIGLEDSFIKFSREEDCHSIIKTEDCTDMVSVMNKLSIIKRSEGTSDTSLRVVYDVYNRDVPNFKKTCPPTPHFRVLCFDQSSTFPNGEDIAGLYSKYNDGVPMVFAVVHEGSISYLQIKNFNLPVYFSNTNIT